MKILKWRTMKNCGRLKAICSVRLDAEQLILHSCCVFKSDAPGEDRSIRFRTTNLEPTRKLLVVPTSKAKSLSLQREFFIALNEYRLTHKNINLYVKGDTWNKLN